MERKVREGDKFKWRDSLTITVTRVAADETWADIEVNGPSGNSWGKRHKLPFPEAYERIEDGPATKD